MLRRIIVLIAIALGCLLPAMADDFVARSGSDTLRLTEKPCTNEAVKKLLQALPERWQEASAIVNGRSYAACWILMQDGMVWLRYEDGDSGRVPAHYFKPEHGV